MPRDISPPEPWLLAANHSGQFWGRRGSTLHIAAGKAYVMEAPRWLADTMVREPQLVLGGSVYTLQETGWVVMYAVSSTRLSVRHAPASAWLGLALVGRLLPWFKRAADRCAGKHGLPRHAYLDHIRKG